MRSRGSALAPALVGLTAGLALFAFMFGWDLPLASAPFWANPKGDMLIMTGGFEAWLTEPWRFPPAVTTRLTGQPVSIVFTDSIPWLALLLKALGLGRVFSPLGLFLLISYVLQPLAMQALLRSLGVRSPWALAAGGLLALLAPPWIARQFGHVALSAHWLLLFTLALCVSSARFGLTWRRAAAFAFLAALAAGVHAYHLPPIGAAFGAALLSELLQRRTGALARTAGAAVLVLASLGLSAWVLGYGVGRGVSGGSAALGFYSMNLLAPFAPQGSFLFGDRWAGQWFTAPFDGTGAQTFEGYQFLGIGALGLLVLGAAIALARPTRRGEFGLWAARFGPLALAMLLLTAAAAGPGAYLGTSLLYDLPKPTGTAAELIGLFRCYGRLFWMVGYLLVALAVAATARLPGRLAAPLLGVIVVLQAVDTSPLRAGVRSVFAKPDTPLYPAGLATAPTIRNRPWVFSPTYFCLSGPMERQAQMQLARLGVITGGAANSFPTARNPDDPCDGPPLDLRRTAAPDDRRIVVSLAPADQTGGPVDAFARRADCYRLAQGIICGRGLDGVPGLEPIRPTPAAEQAARRSVIRFDRGFRPAANLTGWSGPEASGAWSLGKAAEVELIAPSDLKPDEPLRIALTALAYAAPRAAGQTVVLKVNGRRIARLDVAADAFRTYEAGIPPGLLAAANPFVLRIETPQSRSPGSDPRVLGIAVQELKLGP